MRNDAFHRFECHVLFVLTIFLELPRLGKNTLLGNRKIETPKSGGLGGGFGYKLEPPEY